MKSLVFLVVVFLSLPMRVAASDVDALQQLSAQLKQMSSISANFQQITLDGEGNLLQDVTGIMRIKRPQQFYQLAEQPYQHLVVSDGKILWLYDIDLEQATRKPFVPDEGSIPALLLSGEVSQINQRYKVERTEQDSAIQYDLNALKDEAIFHQLRLVFKEQKLISMSFRDDFEQQTKILFTEVIVNGDISDSLFQFMPPNDIDIIDETNPIAVVSSVDSEKSPVKNSSRQ